MNKPNQIQEQQTNIQQGMSQVDFSGGWVANLYPEVAPDQGLRDIYNFELSTRFPNPTKIDGYSEYNSSGQRITGTGTVYWMDILYNGKGDNDYVLAVRDNGNSQGTLWGTKRNDQTPSVIDSSVAGLSVNALQDVNFQIGSTMWEYIAGGGNVKTNGSTVAVVGNRGPSTGFSASKSGTGSIDGTTKIRVAYVYGDFGESNAGDSVSITVSSGNIKIDSLPVQSDSDVTSVSARKIYRTNENVDTDDFFLAEEIEDNTTSVTTLTTTGSVLVANQAMPEDNSQIPDAQISTKFANRVFYAGGDIEKGRIIYSKELKPDTYEAPDNSPSPNVIDTIRGQEGIIMGFGGAKSMMYILTQSSVWLLRGRTPANWTFEKLHDTGTLSPDTVKVIDGMCYFLGSDLKHVYVTDGRKLQPISQGINNYVADLDWENADRFWAIYDSKKNSYNLHVNAPNDNTL